MQHGSLCQPVNIFDVQTKLVTAFGGYIGNVFAMI